MPALLGGAVGVGTYLVSWVKRRPICPKRLGNLDVALGARQVHGRPALQAAGHTRTYKRAQGAFGAPLTHDRLLWLGGGFGISRVQAYIGRYLVECSNGASTRCDRLARTCMLAARQGRAQR